MAFQSSTAKSIFASKTFWGAILTVVSAVTPIALDSIKRKEFTADDAAKIVLIVTGTGITILGRVAAIEPVYTPKGLPGANKEDLLARSIDSSQSDSANSR